MFWIISFQGDARQQIADSVSLPKSLEYRCVGLIQKILLEYLTVQDQTLVYCFNMDLTDIKKLFSPEEWFWNYAQINPKQFSQSWKSNYYSHINSGQWCINNYPGNTGVKIFNVFQTLGDFRDLPSKKFSVWINNKVTDYLVKVSGIEEFDSVEELAAIIKTQYKKKKVVPVHFTPWDSIHYDEQNSAVIDEVNLLYLLDNGSFELSW